MSGINAAYRVQTELPHLNYAILEGRDDIGGTWDLFKYPGVRSDSDLYTYSFSWNPWPHPNPIAEGPLIKEYLKDSIKQHGIDHRIRYRHKVQSMDWSSKSQQWTLAVDHDGLAREIKAQFVILGTGYYDYETPRPATIPGLETFKGRVIHPQFWPQDFDHTNQRIVIVGSGSTAITLLPNLAKTAAKVVMVQRSPTYIASSNNSQPVSAAPLRRLVRLFYHLMAFLGVLFYRTFPTRARNRLLRATKAQLPPGMEVDPHFSPRYRVWDERLCFAPDGDFFAALRRGNADVVTGVIRRVTADAVEMEGGERVPADAIVTATGLNMRLGGDIAMRVDGRGRPMAARAVWRGAMLQDVPNLCFLLGYVDMSWTPGVDSAVLVFVRVVRLMRRCGLGAAVPRLPAAGMPLSEKSVWPLRSTYAAEAQERLPKYGRAGPWRPRGNVLLDYVHSRWGDVVAGLQFYA